jgi:hypothetical protein
VDTIEKIDAILSDTLTPLNIQSFYGWYDENINDTHVTFLGMTDVDTDFSDDEAEATEKYIQVDVWAKCNVEDVKKLVKKTMMSMDGCRYSDGRDFVEDDTGIYHYALRFYITEEIE